jgi:hypothetical protein
VSKIPTHRRQSEVAEAEICSGTAARTKADAEPSRSTEPELELDMLPRHPWLRVSRGVSEEGCHQVRGA